MGKTVYGGVDSVARKIKQPSGGVNAVARKIKNGYNGVNGVARLFFEGLFYWLRYVSRRTGATYGDYKTYTGASLYIQIWPVQDDYDGYGDFIVRESDTKCAIHYYTGFSYATSTGKFTLTGKTTKYCSYVDGLGFLSFSNNDIEQYFVNKYALINGIVYKITGHDDANYLILDEYYARGDAIYSYSYYYDGEVSSEDPNAYPNESISSYTSSDNDDIRTKYVKKT